MNGFFSFDFLIGFITACIATCGFSVIFHVRPKYLVWASIGGGLTYAIYFLIECLGWYGFAPAFFSAMFAAFYSEILARVLRTPATVFLFPCAITIVPGSCLYYSMTGFISQNYTAAFHKLIEMLSIGIGIAGGIVVISILFNIYNAARAHISAQRKSK